MDAKLQWSSHDGKWGMRLNGSNIFNNRFDTRSVQGNQDYRMKINFNWASVTFAVIYKFGGYKEKNVKAVDGENGAFPPTRDGCIHSLSMRERG